MKNKLATLLAVLVICGLSLALVAADPVTPSATAKPMTEPELIAAMADLQKQMLALKTAPANPVPAPISATPAAPCACACGCGVTGTCTCSQTKIAAPTAPAANETLIMVSAGRKTILDKIHERRQERIAARHQRQQDRKTTSGGCSSSTQMSGGCSTQMSGGCASGSCGSNTRAAGSCSSGH